MKRREFIRDSSIASTAPFFFKKYSRINKPAGASVSIFLNEPIAKIRPEVYGHFAEHIGGVIYDGIWVGKDSKIPNINGFRKDLIEHMQQIKPGSLRWPGGCFADSYNWKDGVGLASSRPKRTNFWANTPFLRKAPDGPSKYEPNHFGTDEFLGLCELLETKPYLGANARTLGPQDLMDWVEYCNAPVGTTTYGDQRAANGHRAPYQVEYWGVGNESWGCGGDMIPEDYATEFRRFTSFIPHFDVNMKLVAVGPSDSWNRRDTEWTRRFFTSISERSAFWSDLMPRIQGYSIHFYCGTTGSSSLDYTDADYYEHLWRADQMEKIITEHWKVMGAFDFDRKIKLYVDEWGAWHLQKTEVHNTHLFGQTSTMRDALIAALTLDTFNRHADKVVMGNIAQLINNLHSLFLAHEDRFAVTPNFHVFDMYKDHQNGTALRTEIQAPSTGSERDLWGLAGSASQKDGKIFLTMVNPHLSETQETQISIPGAKIKSASASVFRQDEVRAFNNLEQPNGIRPPIEEDLDVRSSEFIYSFKPASVTGLTLVME